MIPNKILLVAAVLGVAIAAVGDPSSLPERAIAAAAAGGILFLVVLAYPKGMGLGDVKLTAVMGLYLGRNVAPAVLVALLVGSVVGLAMIARQGAAARKQAIPFGPFLALGGVVGLLAGRSAGRPLPFDLLLVSGSCTAKGFGAYLPIQGMRPAVGRTPFPCN